jgi:hypothetical protein
MSHMPHISDATPHLTLLAVLAAVAATVSTIAACELPVACTLEARASLSVHVQDSAGTGIDDATVSARPDEDGAADQACEAIGAGDYVCPFFEDAGDFVVSASRPGFVDATAGATVESDACGVVPADVLLVLSASDGPCCCASIIEGDIITEAPADTVADCAAREQGTCIDPSERLTPNACCPDATGDRCG